MNSFWRELRAPLTLVLAISLAINLALLAPSLFMLQVFDRVLATRSIETLVMVASITVLTLLMMGALEYFRTRALTAVGVMIEQRLGPRLLAQLLTTSAGRAGAPYRDGLRDLASVRGFLAGAGVVALCDAPWIFVYVVVIFMFNATLGLLAAGCALLLLALGLVNERVLRGPVAELHESGRDGGRFIDNAMRQAEVITAMGMAGAAGRRWDVFTRRSQVLQVAISKRGGALGAASRMSRQFVQVLMLGAGAWLIIRDGATAGVMLATTVILSRALAPVEQLIGGWKAMVDARGAFARLNAALQEPVAGTVATELPRPSGRLELEQVGYAAPGTGRALVRGVSFTIQPGQVMALVGASGSGKTTLARMLVGVMAPTAGKIRLDGADLRMFDPERLGSWVGYLPQDVSLFGGSVSENIARLGAVDSAAVLAAAELAHAHEMVLRLPNGYDTQVGEGGAMISGGQRQRVGLARALYGSPQLVVLDEPDASLDADGEKALLETLRQLKERQVTVLVITQRRAVLSVADGVIVMNGGQIEKIAAIGADAPSGATPLNPRQNAA